MVLKTGTVTVSRQGSDITLYAQDLLSSMTFDFDGKPILVEVEDAAILSPYGLDTLCRSMSLYHPQHVSVAGEPFLKASLNVQGIWDHKEAFKGEMRLLGVDVTEEFNPYDYERTTTILSVTGAENIFHFGRTLRDEFAHVQLEVDELPRQLVNPELIGLLLDDVAEQVAKGSVQTGNPFHANAYRHDWAA